MSPVTAAFLILGWVIAGLLFVALCGSEDQNRDLRTERDKWRTDARNWRDKYHKGVGALIAEVHGSSNATYHLLKWEKEMEQR